MKITIECEDGEIGILQKALITYMEKLRECVGQHWTDTYPSDYVKEVHDEYKRARALKERLGDG